MQHAQQIKKSPFQNITDNKQNLFHLKKQGVLTLKLCYALLVKDHFP